MDARLEKNQEHEMFIKKLSPFVDLDCTHSSDTREGRQVALARLIREEENEELFQSSILEEGIANTSGENIVYFELINIAMAKADQYYFKSFNQNNENINQTNGNYYVPYLYFAAFELNKKNIKYFRKHIGSFFQNGVINEYIPCLITSHHEEIEQAKGIDSLTVFSASPFRFARNTIDFVLDGLTKEETNEINQLKQMCETLYSWQGLSDIVLHNQEDIDNHISSFSGCPESNQKKPFVGSLKIYNVGQANCAYIRNDNNLYTMMIDIGADKRFIRRKIIHESDALAENGKMIERNYRYIGNTHPKVIILTHWDMDHLLGVCLLDKESFQATWIAPDVAENNRMALFLKRLILYLYQSHSLLMIGKEFNGEKVWSNDFISIYKGITGIRGRSSKSKKNNDQGMIVTIKNEIIFPGDCAYLAWPRELDISRHTYQYLIVPHHGGEVGDIPDNLMKEDDLKRNKCAIFSYGYLNQYNHPYPSHANKIVQKYKYERVDLRDYPYMIIYLDEHILPTAIQGILEHNN